MRSDGESEDPPDRSGRNLMRLREIATRIRLRLVEMIAPTGQGYVQQGLGAADLFTALYFAEARLDPSDPLWPDRDRIYLSTAHNTAVFYATLSRRGFIDAQDLSDYCRDGSPLEINASERAGPFVEATCGSLGQALSVAAGTAAALKRQGRSSRVYVILGDGELQEGQVWEAAYIAGCWALDNLCVVIDYNRMQAEGHIDRVLPVEPVSDKWESFGFSVTTLDGNDIGALLDAFDKARAKRGAPSCLIADTSVGKGVSFLEGMMAHQLRLPPEVAENAISELESKLRKISAE